MIQSATIGKLALALSKAQAMFDGASKTSDNPFFKSKYADLHECIQAAKPALSSNELAVIQTTDTDESGGIWIYTTLMHSSGEWAQGKIKMKPKKDDDQALGSSITYGRRYTFAAIVGLAQKDDDGNGSAGVGDETKNTDKEKKEPQQKPSKDDEILEKWLAWVDKYVNAKSLDIFLADWEKFAVPTISKMPQQHKEKMLNMKKQVESVLIEKQGAK